ncbi:hypothetical protein [Paenibacillus xylanexedens]|uniref:hypothetical protein n=1 Tax=Paenibacillus xylanexedens TaxID=528191 RepID=UPI00119E0C08|nr:hypothetical protein [Paenibacillus xylanexedens]
MDELRVQAALRMGDKVRAAVRISVNAEKVMDAVDGRASAEEVGERLDVLQRQIDRLRELLDQESDRK